MRAIFFSRQIRAITVKLGIKELFIKEQIGNSEPFTLTNMPVYLINSEQICNDQKKFLHRLYKLIHSI